VVNAPHHQRQPGRRQQLPYIKRAKKIGYAVVVLNTNNNKYENGAAIEGSETPIRHAVSAWKQVVMKCPAKHIAVVAHSFGGVVTCNLVKTFFQFFNEKVFAIMFADSIHQLEKDSSKTAKLLERIGLNYVASDLAVGTRIKDDYEAVPILSAGHPSHEWSSTSAFANLFQTMEEKLQSRIGNKGYV
jgi:hypothetical protein